jgi:hypothetical protein
MGLVVILLTAVWGGAALLLGGLATVAAASDRAAEGQHEQLAAERPARRLSAVGS